MAVDVGHGDEGAAFDLFDFVNGADVGVVEGGGGLGFAREARADFGIGDQMRGQKFQGHGAVQARVFGFVDDAHAAAAELGEDAVGAELLSGGDLARLVEGFGGEGLHGALEDALVGFVGGQ